MVWTFQAVEKLSVWFHINVTILSHYEKLSNIIAMKVLVCCRDCQVRQHSNTSYMNRLHASDQWTVELVNPQRSSCSSYVTIIHSLLRLFLMKLKQEISRTIYLETPIYYKPNEQHSAFDSLSVEVKILLFKKEKAVIMDHILWQT